MVKKIIPLILLVLLLTGCNDAPLPTKNQALDQDAITACKDKPCPQVTLDYLIYEGEQEVITPINNKIESFIITSLYLGDPEAHTTAKTPSQAIAQFIDDYWRDTSEFPDIHEYEAEVSVEETFRNKEIATVALHQYTYTGGAHGNGSLQYVNFDIETGEIVKNDALIKDEKGLAIRAEKQLRKDYELSEKESLNATVFWFENDRFALSNNIGFEKGKLVIHYNQYEIASYADGPIDIELPLEDVAPFLSYSVQQ